MYNRYIPQPDGSYRRNPLPSAPPRPQRPPTPPAPQPPPEHCEPVAPDMNCPAKQGFRAGDFLRRLLPKNLDTGDLLIIVLLLLMSADCEEEQNTALLTLALYLFM